MLMTIDKPNDLESPDDLLTPEEAAAYLARRWGRKSFSVEGLRSLRRRLNLKPVKQTARMTLYRRSQLDEIDEPEVKGRYPVDKN